MIDLNHIPARHDAINLRLEEWARYVRVRPQAWGTQPMFRHYRAPRQYESQAVTHVEINTLDAHEIERAVSHLPDKHRAAIRWYYVFAKKISITKMRQELGVTVEALAGLVDAARDMLKNRIRQRMVEK